MPMLDSATAKLADGNIKRFLVEAGEALFGGLFGIPAGPVLAQEGAKSPVETRIAELTEAVQRRRNGGQEDPS